jgi:pterin-4a-carbinolamine dehydratase
MQVFFGSSTESSELMEEVAAWIEKEEGVDVLLWNDRRAFPLGQYTLNRLIELTRIVDASVLIFGEDDRVWYRDSENQQPRDNVLLEYGLFASRLGLSRSIACRINRSKVPSDLLGVTTLNISSNNRIDARLRIRDWVRTCKSEIGPLLAAEDLRAEFKTPGTCDHVARRLLPEELTVHLKTLSSWRVVVGMTNDTPPKSKRELARMFKFPSFLDAMRFIALAANDIDRRNHHPRWENVFDQVIIYLSTWNIGYDISSLDVDLARHLDDLYVTRFAK